MLTNYKESGGKMNTLIIPCAGKSTRFPNMKPKYMLTHPDGKLMIEKSLENINCDIFDRIIITIVRPHAEQYEADIIMKQVFANNPKVELCILENFTSSASETIYLTLKKMKVQGSIVIKDSDNRVGVQFENIISNMIVGYDLQQHPNVSNIPGKSFLILNGNRQVVDIVEKQIVSNIICLGVYCFSNADAFIQAYMALQNQKEVRELFISNLISFMIKSQKQSFTSKMAYAYDDWGTLNEWINEQKKCRTYFVDVDGVIIKNSGKYGRVNWYNNSTLLQNNIQFLKLLQEAGAQIIITTSRPEEFRAGLEKIFSTVGLKPYAILMGLNHAARLVINDFAPTNPYPSCMAISLPRNGKVSEYFR